MISLDEIKNIVMYFMELKKAYKGIARNILTEHVNPSHLDRPLFLDGVYSISSCCVSLVYLENVHPEGEYW